MKNLLLVCGVGLALVSGCTDYGEGKSSIHFSWVMGESGLSCTGEVDQVGIFLASEGGGVFYNGNLPCSDGEATIDGLELGSYQLILTGICGGQDIGYEFWFHLQSPSWGPSPTPGTWSFPASVSTSAG